MNIESEIQTLLEQAAPLRLLDADDPKALPLGAIVDKINALRAIQSAETAEFRDDVTVAPWPVEGAEAEPPEKRKPGRPKKAE